MLVCTVSIELFLYIYNPNALCNRMKPPNKGHVGDLHTISCFVFVERLSSFRGSQCIETIPGIGRIIFFWTSRSSSILYRDVYYTTGMSLSQSVHYKRSNCIIYNFRVLLS